MQLLATTARKVGAKGLRCKRINTIIAKPFRVHGDRVMIIFGGKSRSPVLVHSGSHFTENPVVLRGIVPWFSVNLCAHTNVFVAPWYFEHIVSFQNRAQWPK